MNCIGLGCIGDLTAAGEEGLGAKGGGGGGLGMDAEVGLEKLDLGGMTGGGFVALGIRGGGGAAGGGLMFPLGIMGGGGGAGGLPFAFGIKGGGGGAGGLELAFGIGGEDRVATGGGLKLLSATGGGEGTDGPLLTRLPALGGMGGVGTEEGVEDPSSLFFNLGIPPANKPPNAGGPSLLVFDVELGGRGTEGGEDFELLLLPDLGLASTIGALLSFVTDFFNLVPF